MSQHLLSFFRISLYAFVPWAITLWVLSVFLFLPRPWFVIVHYFLIVMLFGLTFRFYHQRHTETSAFQTTAYAFIALVLFESLFWNYFYTGSTSYFNFVDWIFPAFLVVSTIYAVGKRVS